MKNDKFKCKLNSNNVKGVLSTFLFSPTLHLPYLILAPSLPLLLSLIVLALDNLTPIASWLNNGTDQCLPADNRS